MNTIEAPMNPPETVPYSVIVERDMTIRLLKQLVREAYLEASMDDDQYNSFDVPPQWATSDSNRQLMGL